MHFDEFIRTLGYNYSPSHVFHVEIRHKDQQNIGYS